MASDNRDDEPKRTVRVHEVGQDLSTLSVFELDERVAQLETEINRIRAVRDSKDRSKAAAASFFKL